jgi:hypothetical protein
MNYIFAALIPRIDEGQLLPLSWLIVPENVKDALVVVQ